MRRPGVGANRRVGFRGFGGQAGGSTPYTPLDEASLLEWWAADDLANGAVASWLGRKGVATWVQASGPAQPTKSATALTAPDGTTYPGVTFGGSHSMSTADLGPAIDLIGKFTMIASLADTTTGLSPKIVVEYTANAFSGAGGLLMFVNNGVADTIDVGARAGGNGVWRSSLGLTSLADPCVVTSKWDLSINDSKSVMQVDGIDLTGAPVFTSISGGTTWGNATMYLAARAGTSLFWSGAFRDIVFLDGTDDAAARARVLAYQAARIGVVV